MPGSALPAPHRRPKRIAAFARPSATPERTPPAQPQRPRYDCCESPDVGFDEGEGRTVCFVCAAVHAEDMLQAEVTFAETSGGRSVAQGGVVGNDQRHAHSMGGTAAGIHGGDGGQTTAQRGKSMIAITCHKVGLPPESPIEIGAMKWYRIALLHSFVQGRGVSTVAAAAIYLASRERPGGDILLIDLAEAIQVNLWRLGTVYTDLCKVLMTDPSTKHERVKLMDLEPLMLKYCLRLDFDQDAYRVAADAMVILKRMDRDWIVQGRNPAGVCGACIIQAARMNNFRRTVREVVYVCKVADTTINQRLHEFRRTQSATLTVKQFREYAPKLKTKIAPPSIYRRLDKENKVAGKKRSADASDNGTQGSENDTGGDAGDATTPLAPSKPTKRQEAMRKKQKLNNGEPVEGPPQEESQAQPNGEDTEVQPPDVEALTGDNLEGNIDAIAGAHSGSVVDEEAIIVPKRRGRPPKKRAPIIIPDEDIQIENELEAEIIANLKKWDVIFKKIKEDGDHPELLKAFDMARKLVDHYQPPSNPNLEEDIREDEFADDPDVQFCLNTPEEALTKERLWLKENEQWLRDQQAKILQKAIEEARGNPKKQKQKRRKQQIGDGSLLEGRPATSAAEAAKTMLNKRAKHFSSHINYDIFKELMPGASSSSEGTVTPADQAATPAPEQPAHQTVPVGEGDEEIEEVEIEEQYAEEEEELDHQYLSDDDQGFDENESYDY